VGVQDLQDLSKSVGVQDLPRKVWVSRTSNPGPRKVWVSRTSSRTSPGPLQDLPGPSHWYDPTSGAWGVAGGPALGFAPPGLEWGGKLRADASNGDTGVFVNGRELHRVDVALLMQITTVIPGRYWVNAIGDYGFEGGPKLGNFVLLIQAATKATRREGILSGYDKTGASVIGGEVLMH